MGSDHERALLDLAHNAFVSMDPQGRIVAWNASAERIFGLSREQAIGRSLAETITRHGEGWRGRGGMVVITANRSSEWVEALVDTATRGQRHLCIFIEPTSFGAKGQALRIPAAWRLALDWWVVRRGDVLGTGERTSATG